LNTNFIYEAECSQIIGAAYDVHNELGNGFLESVYEEAFAIIMDEKNIPYDRQTQLNIFFRGRELEKYFIADFICYNSIIVEIKACDTLRSEHMAQMMNYLKATKKKLGLLINFGSPRVQVKRVIL
jgi:GxxExxY protein